jgi:hypothetical protein
MPTPFLGQTPSQARFGRELGNLRVHIDWAKEFDLLAIIQKASYS